MKKVLAAVLVLGLVVAGILLWWKHNGAAATVEDKISTDTVKRGPIRQEVQCTGRTVSNRDVEIKCRASGEIVKLPFDISDKVKTGDLLLELDPVDQERTVQQYQATLDASEARIAQAENSLLVAQKTVEVNKLKVQSALDSAKARAVDAKSKAARQSELLQKKYSSPEQYETARTTDVQAGQDVLTAEANLADIQVQELDIETRRQDIKLFKAQAESNRIALALAQRQLGYTKVFAPADGVISARSVQIGQIISSGVTNIGGGTTTMVLSDLSHVFIYAAVDESYIGDVKLGQRARITADAFPRIEFEGAVDRIGTKGTNVQNVVTFEVRIEVVSDNKTFLKPEMTANVYIVVAEKEDALMVPATSITRKKQDTFVKLAKEGGATEERQVQIGITDYVNTEIVDGLQEGDTVVVQKPEDESRWRNSPEMQRGMQNRMMLRTLGGGGGGGRH